MKNGIRQPTPEELGIINQHYAKKELKAEDIYVFDLKAANNKTVTAYFSKLGDDMIEAFQENVMKKHSDPEAPIIGYLFGHNKEMIPSGTVFNSKLDAQEPTEEGETRRLDFRPSVFMSKNLNVGGTNTDDYVKAYEAGHTEDVSVGFIAGSYLCDICNNDVRSWSCSHVPGRVYNLSEDPEKPIMRQATYTVHQGPMKKLNLAEISGVYRGALWGARVDNQFSFKDTVRKDSLPTVFMSRNIKEFKEGDILRFNCAGDGVIELVSREGNAPENQAEELKAAQDKVTAQTIENRELRERREALLKERETLFTQKAELEESLKLASKNLGLSETDKVNLQQQLEAATKKIKTLEEENAALKTANDKFLQELKARCKKLSIQVNGQNHKPELFAKEIGALSADEIRTKIAALEEQLASLYPPGRKSQQSEKVQTGLRQDLPQVDPKLFKIT